MGSALTSGSDEPTPSAVRQGITGGVNDANFAKQILLGFSPPEFCRTVCATELSTCKKSH